MKFLAHITDADGERLEQSLQKHCVQTAEYASQSIGNAKFQYVGFLAGLLHDAGKFQEEYQNYLEKASRGEKVVRGSVIHTFQGCIYVLEKFHRSESSLCEKITSEIIAYAIGAHHGLFDCVNMDGVNGFRYRIKKDRTDIEYKECIKNFFEQVADEKILTEYFQKAVGEIQDFYTEVKRYRIKKNEFPFYMGMLSRLILSAVVLGDRKDTGEFMDQRKLEECCITWKERRQYFEEKIKKFDAKTQLNQVRADISRQCLEFAERPCGIYRLNVPTGSGKTLSALRYALAHAEKYKKKRIIFIIPLLSILDQNAQVIRDYLPDGDEVLEHHSNVIREGLRNSKSTSENDSRINDSNLPDNRKNRICFLDGNEADEETEELDRYELLTERWSSPIIISTLVQLLEILFSYKTSSIGRMQALSDSVLVIDEVQSLPKKTTLMFNMAMNFLSHFCNTTIILSSATQPCFEELKWPIHFSENPDMVRLTSDQLQVFQRCRIINRVLPGGMNWEECEQFCAKLMEKHASVLMITNTKASAEIVYEKMQRYAESDEWEIFHLSTSMCQQHRMDVIKELAEKLQQLQNDIKNNRKVKKIFCVSTQLLEAGVDLSFEAVIRVIAGIDNLAQAAGRCNRANEYGHQGTVYLINLQEERLNMLKEIRIAQLSTENVLEHVKKSEAVSLIGEEASSLFYCNLYENMQTEIRYPIKVENEKYYLADLLSGKWSIDLSEEDRSYFLKQPFKFIGKNFEVFDNDTIGVIVPYKDGRNIIAQIRKMDNGFFQVHALKALLQKAKPYTINVFRYQMEKLWDEGLVSSAFDGRIGILDEKAYDLKCGLMDFRKQDVRNFVL